MSNFFIIVTGEACGAQEQIVRKLEHKGLIQKKSVEESDYILAFCPIPSRTGTDVQEAMERIPSGKPVILVVMRHRHDVPAHLDDSSRHVTRDDVILTVDTLFWKGEFLNCSHNEKAFRKVLDAVGYSSTIFQSIKPVEAVEPVKKTTGWLSHLFVNRPQDTTSTSTSEKKIKQDTETVGLGSIKETQVDRRRMQALEKEVKELRVEKEESDRKTERRLNEIERRQNELDKVNQAQQGATHQTQEVKGAQEKLTPVRQKFIGGVSVPVVHSMLDELFHKGVIKHEEMDTVRTEKLVQEKARIIFDMVLKKGDKACSIMIEILQNDQNLRELLN